MSYNVLTVAYDYHFVVDPAAATRDTRLQRGEPSRRRRPFTRG